MTTPYQVPLFQISYLDPDRNLWGLSDLSLANGYICTALEGIAGVPVQLTSIPLVNGTAQPQMYSSQPGTVTLGLYVEAKDFSHQADFLKLVDNITYAFFNQRAGIPAPGYIVVQRPDGTSRQLAVYCTAGFENPDYSTMYANFVLSLTALDPYWTDTVAQQITYGLPAGATGILPLLPVALGASNVIGTSTLNNDGGADAYPSWDIYGPGTPTITNNTSGRSFALTGALATGDQVHVETRPGVQAVYKVATAANMWSNLVINSPRDLWPIVKGMNSINLAMSGSGPSSKIVLNWTRRWLRA
jgi:hypothetical protein